MKFFAKHSVALILSSLMVIAAIIIDRVKYARLPKPELWDRPFVRVVLVIAAILFVLKLIGGGRNGSYRRKNGYGPGGYSGFGPRH